MRISIDAKATIKIGPFSRGGYSRQGEEALDHDFGPVAKLNLFGIFLPAHDESFFYFSQSNITADFIVDTIEDLWPQLKDRFNPHTIVINADNGPENNSRRTQFIKRIVEFAQDEKIDVILAYYPPYHSKYNPVERVWGVLERHWNGEILGSIKKALGLANTMTWNGKHPIVKIVKGIYKTGAKLTKKAMREYESLLLRQKGLEKWFVTIPCYQEV